MFIRKHVLMEEVDPNKGGGGGVSAEEFKKLQESVEGLKTSNEALEAKNRELLKEKKDAAKKAEEAALEAARKGGDLEALERSWQEKLEKATGEKETLLQQYQSMVHSLTVGATATKLASEIALPGSADVLLPHISQRLTVEIKDNKPMVRVLDKDGKPSAMSLDELKAEVTGNPAFAPIVVGSKANGSGKFNSGGSGGATLYRDEMTAADVREYQSKHGQAAYLALPKSRQKA